MVNIVKLDYFTNLPLFSLYAQRPEMEKFYNKCHFDIEYKTFLNLYVSAAFAICFILFIFLLIFIGDFAFATGIFIILVALALLLGYRLPKYLAKWQAKKFEQDLPAVLRAISLYLQIGMTLEKAIYNIAVSNYSCSNIFKKIYDSINLGSSVPAALSKIQDYVYSMHFSRAAHALLLCYEKGYSPTNLESLADDISSLAQTEIKQQSSRLTLLALVFVAVSSIIPAFYLIIFVAAGPMFGATSSPENIFLFYIILLPLLVIATLAIMIFITPSATSPILYDKVFAQTNEKLIKKSNIFKNRYALSIALAIFGYGLGLLLGLTQQALFIALFFGSIPFLIHSFYESEILAQVSEMEEQLPNMLLAGAAEKKFSLEKMLIDSSNSPSKLLSIESKQALNQIKAGANPVDVLKKWQESTPSLLLIRALKLVLIGYVSGGNMQKALRSAAEDILTAFNLARERSALISLQTYTLLAAGAILVPIILSISISFANQLVNLSMPSEFNLFSKESQTQLIESSKIAIPVYLFINAGLVAFAVSSFQNARQKFIFYFILIAIVSELIWFALPLLSF